MRNLATTLVLCSLLGCGANLEKAEDANLDSNVLSLDSKVSDTCQILNSQHVSPNFQDMYLEDFCTRQKSPAIILGNESIGFTKLTDRAITMDNGDEVYSLNSQSEIWLGKTMLDLAGIFRERLDNPPADNDTNKEKSMLDLKVVGDPVVNKKKLEISLKVHIESPRSKNGFLNINNDLNITARLVESKYLAVEINSIGITPVEQSLFRGLKVVVLAVPHAGDMYLAILTRIDLHSFGPGVDKKTRKIILGGVEDALKKIPKLLNGADK